MDFFFTFFATRLLSRGIRPWLTITPNSGLDELFVLDGYSGCYY